MSDREKVIKGIQECDLNGGLIGNCPYKSILTLLKEQDAEIRQLRLVLDISKRTCKEIVVETDEKYMGDL